MKTSSTRPEKTPNPVASRLAYIFFRSVQVVIAALLLGPLASIIHDHPDALAQLGTAQSVGLIVEVFLLAALFFVFGLGARDFYKDFDRSHGLKTDDEEPSFFSSFGS